METKCLREGQGGGCQPKSLNGLRPGVRAKGLQRRRGCYGLTENEVLLRSFFFWYSDSHLRLRRVQAEVKARAGVWK